MMLPDESESSCAPPTVRPNNTETSEFGAEKGLLQGHAKRWVARAQKVPTPRRVSAKHF